MAKNMPAASSLKRHREKEEHGKRIHKSNTTYPKATKLSKLEVRQHVSLMYPMAIVHTGPNPKGVTLRHFPAINRKTLQLVFMGLPAHIGSSSDAFDAIPEFTPLLSDCRHDGINPELCLSAVEIPVTCFYRGPDIKHVSESVQHCMALPCQFIRPNPASQDEGSKALPGTSTDPKQTKFL